MIDTPTIPSILVELDAFGGGVTETGVRYATFDLSRPRRDKLPIRLASVTLYEEGAPGLVFDRSPSIPSAADQRAMGRIRDWISANMADAQHNSYRYL